NFFVHQPFSATGVHPTAIVGNACRLSADISIGPTAIIGNRVKIGNRVTIHPGVVIGDDARIGDDTVLHANVNIGHYCKLGKRIIIHAGTVVGADGFGYATDQYGHHLKRPQVGFVQIDDDVEIGANSCLDRATFGRTWVKRGCKIDNLVQIGHNAVIGEDSLIVSQAGVAGSSTLGTGVILGGQVGVSGHLKLGNRVMVGAKSGVHGNLTDNEVVSGYPAFSHKLWLRVCAIIPRLPELFRDVRALKRQCKEQEK
ncbi:MAG: UDP-3-O-(3-hydroxymyristoyl)glucosamine N-acyltransferase, partial [Deltaproteobacteria bacterium]|nr:UDP-3-O-(3-hydroxymyristoyl)glucosamine N-acyltransferase [Deltaproteobacteria bacterium]